ncbi:vWA domain-containing protein [Celeribacter halophilus]|uniref:vWA domain-containing protein n=1 Tax=Celeribacter halophilus TaxID=576117 RepID=UPI003A9101D5
MRKLRTFFFCIAAAMATAAPAQEAPRAILVLDGSGSMWGQIDGKAKITIAQEVVGELLDSLPETQALGLTVYGHRRKGDCSDIETLVAPAAGTHDAIIAAVNGIKPKGKTPMTDAVRQAAEALRYTEEKATVILVSDGIETCCQGRPQIGPLGRCKSRPLLRE